MSKKSRGRRTRSAAYATGIGIPGKGSKRKRQLIGSFIVIRKPSVNPAQVLYAGPCLGITKGFVHIGGHYKPRCNDPAVWVAACQLVLNDHRLTLMKEPLLGEYLRANKSSRSNR